MKNLLKLEAEKKIKNFFENLENKKPREIKKIKKLAMHYNIKLGNSKKKFCKKCFSLFPKNAEIRIKKKMKIVKCENCGFVSRWRLK